MDTVSETVREQMSGVTGLSRKLLETIRDCALLLYRHSLYTKEFTEAERAWFKGVARETKQCLATMKENTCTQS